MAHKRKDILLKSMIEDFPEDFVKFFYKDADNLFDLEAGFEFMDNELSQIAPDEEYMKDSVTIDKLLKGKARDLTLDPLLLLAEIQGYKQKEFTQRVL